MIMRHITKRKYIYRKRQYLLEIREMKRRRYRKFRIYRGKITQIETSRFKRFCPKALRYLDEKWHCKARKISDVQIPENFSFKENFNESVDVIKDFLLLLLYKRKEFQVDFSKCKNLSFSAIFLMNLIFQKYGKTLDVLDALVGLIRQRKIKVIPPQGTDTIRVYKYLHALEWYCSYKFTDSDGEFMRLGLQEGKYRGFKENRKGVVGKRIVSFINSSYGPLKKKLTHQSQNLIESLISEILNNAEDHSLQNNEWYVDGIALHETIDEKEVVELNLVIFNLGDSMYDAFEKTKEDNGTIYNKLENRYLQHKRQFTLFKRFEKKSLFTLYMLNEGISRLKFKDPSRGNGTMQFLKAFADLGTKAALGEDSKSCLNVISGHTVLTCDDEVVPFVNGTHLIISLNSQKNNKDLPDSQYLKYYSRYIPGTFIDCKIYITDNFVENIKNEDN